MKPTWTVSRLLREYPQCKKVLDSYEINVKDVSALTIAALADEIEEDLDDFIDQLDSVVNSYSDYDVDEDDELDAEDDDEYESTEDEVEDEEAPAVEGAFDDAPLDGEDDLFGGDDAAEDDDEAEDEEPVDGEDDDVGGGDNAGGEDEDDD